MGELGRFWSLIIRNFVFLVVISCLIAFPVAWYFMHKWLELFPQGRIEAGDVFAVCRCGTFNYRAYR